MSSLFSLVFQQNSLGSANLHFHNKQTVVRSRFKFPLLTVESKYTAAFHWAFSNKNFNWLFLNFNQSFVLLECH